MKYQSQRGIALVITLVMLSVITFMTIAFLFLSRTERAAVTVDSDRTDAKLMAETALARAQAETAERILSRTNFSAFDLLVSTNYINPAGFLPGVSHPTNVNYRYRVDNRPLENDDWIQNIANLQYNSRPPVFIETNENPNAPLDFRFFLDFNRNRQFDTNGLRPVFVTNNLVLLPDGSVDSIQNALGGPIVSNFFVGDPEWIGVLHDPNEPHSGTNRFIGRYAYLVLPAGKSLDLNHIHNQSTTPRFNVDGYLRNQGYGSWEINLAAFLSDLNTNVWPNPDAWPGTAGAVADQYDYRPASPSGGASFNDALTLLLHRYNGSFNNLDTVSALFGQRGAGVFGTDLIDGYADGPMMGGFELLSDNDNPDKPWSGSDNPRSFFDLQQLFETNSNYIPLATRLDRVGNPPGSSDYDRYTFYRLLGQMGVDSAPASAGKVNLNFVSDLARMSTNYVRWEPIEFFTNVAQRLIEYSLVTNVTQNAGGNTVTNLTLGGQLVRPDFNLQNIQVYPTNEYSAAVHRLLQLSANLFDYVHYDYASQTRPTNSLPLFPSVFRPLLAAGNNDTNIIISGFEEVTSARDVLGREWVDLEEQMGREEITLRNRDVFALGIPLVIGAKKGYPNFNEFHLSTVAEVTRKLAVGKPGVNAPPAVTNQMYLLGISNRFGIEGWNSYQTPYPRPLRLLVTNRFSMALSNENRRIWPTNGFAFEVYSNDVSLNPNEWQGQQFQVPIDRMEAFLPSAVYRSVSGTFDTNLTSVPQFERGVGFPVPQWTLSVTAQVQYVLLDTSQNPSRIVDFVNLTDITNHINITRHLTGQFTQDQGGQPDEMNVWLTNRVDNSTDVNKPTVGIENQIEISLGNIQADWENYDAAIDDRQKAIDKFRVFHGLTPHTYPLPVIQESLRQSVALTNQTPFNPTQVIRAESSLQVNDPFVHYTLADLFDMTQTNRVTNVDRGDTAGTLGEVNDRYRPWGRRPTDPDAFNLALKDPLIRESEDWNFPEDVQPNYFPNVGWVGRVHRGSPWQTVYLKSDVPELQKWRLWAGHPGTHPTNDWNLLEVFTVAPNGNAASGLLSVNQTNRAAWSAVLSGMPVVSNAAPVSEVLLGNLVPTNVLIEPNSPQVVSIVDGINAARRQMPTGEFRRMGEVLAAPELTVDSPFLNVANDAQRQRAISDDMYERIPQMTLSLLKEDKSRVVVYAYGQSLKPAQNSLILSGPQRGMSTNYQIMGEVVTKSVIRFEGSLENPRAVVESYNILESE